VKRPPTKKRRQRCGQCKELTHDVYPGPKGKVICKDCHENAVRYGSRMAMKDNRIADEDYQ
jgi:hypothetical protein